jgi:hypothetical protein
MICGFGRCFEAKPQVEAKPLMRDEYSKSSAMRKPDAGKLRLKPELKAATDNLPRAQLQSSSQQ